MFLSDYRITFLLPLFALFTKTKKQKQKWAKLNKDVLNWLSAWVCSQYVFTFLIARSLGLDVFFFLKRYKVMNIEGLWHRRLKTTTKKKQKTKQNIDYKWEEIWDLAQRQWWLISISLTRKTVLFSPFLWWTKFRGEWDQVGIPLYSHPTINTKQTFLAITFTWSHFARYLFLVLSRSWK